MSMKANIIVDSCGNVQVQMKGALNYETTLPFRDEMLAILNSNPTSKITLDMNDIDFVGSSGIANFVETIKHINSKKENCISLINVAPEFLKVFKLYTKGEKYLIIKEIENFSNDEVKPKKYN